MSFAGRSYLLDTHVLIWLSSDLERIPRAVRGLLESLDDRVYVSSVSFWELAIKQGAGKISSAIQFEQAVEARGIEELVVTSKYMDAVRGLPLLHGDPFDRMLVAQAMVEGMTLVTADRRLAGYPVGILQV